MKDKEKLEKIKAILNKASNDFTQAKLAYTKNKKGKITGVYVTDSKAQKQKNLKENFYVYAKALEDICNLIGYKNKKRPNIKE
jgi:hypothetical protein